MSKIKVLPLERWMMFSSDDEKECDPVFNRDGYYFDRLNNKCWYEVKSKAYVYNKNYFLYNLKLLNVRKFTNQELKALNILLINKILTKDLSNQLYYYNCWKDNREVYRNSRKFFLNKRKKIC